MFRNSSGPLQPDPGAVAGDRASAAPGRDRDAQVLPESNKNIVKRFPVPLWQCSAQDEFRFFRRFSRNVTPKIRNPMHVGIDTDSIVAETHREDQVRGFSSDSGEFEELLHRSGDAAAVILQKSPAHLDQVSGFRVIKPDRVYQPLNFFDR